MSPMEAEKNKSVEDRPDSKTRSLEFIPNATKNQSAEQVKSTSKGADLSVKSDGSDDSIVTHEENKNGESTVKFDLVDDTSDTKPHTQTDTKKPGSGKTIASRYI